MSIDFLMLDLSSLCFQELTSSKNQCSRQEIELNQQLQAVKKIKDELQVGYSNLILKMLCIYE